MQNSKYQDGNIKNLKDSARARRRAKVQREHVEFHKPLSRFERNSETVVRAKLNELAILLKNGGKRGGRNYRNNEKEENLDQRIIRFTFIENRISQYFQIYHLHVI